MKTVVKGPTDARFGYKLRYHWNDKIFSKSYMAFPEHLFNYFVEDSLTAGTDLRLYWAAHYRNSRDDQ